MPQLITPAHIVTMTQDGEVKVTIVLELNINLNSGELSASLNAAPKKGDLPKSKYEEVDWSLPELSSGTKLEFGKDINKEKN